MVRQMEAPVGTYVMMRAGSLLHAESRPAIYLLIEGSKLAEKDRVWL